MSFSRTVMIVAALGGVGCVKKEAPADQVVDTVSTTAAPMAMQGMQMMPAMQAHLDSMASMTPAQMSAAMAAHQDLTSRMMDAMGAEMRGMGMQPDSAWSALGDSLRYDLAELPGLSGATLKARMDTHAGRLKRMMVLHEQMMKM
jgi:hypothetical protein